MQPITVRLANREYKVKPLPVRPSRAFRQRIGEQISGLTDLVAEVLTPTGEAASVSDLSSLTEMIGGLGQAISQKVIGSTDLIADLLFEYSPELNTDRERIELEAYDEEIIAAFVEVLKLLYPFGSLTTILRNGREARQT